MRVLFKYATGFFFGLLSTVALLAWFVPPSKENDSVLISSVEEKQDELTVTETGSVSKIFYFNAHNGGGWTDVNNIVDSETTPPSTFGYTTALPKPRLILTGNNCTGSDLGTISSVKFRAYDEKTGTGAVANKYKPQFTAGSGTEQTHTLGSATWTSWYDITTDTHAPSPWTWTDVVNLDMNVNITNAKFTVNRLYIVQINVTYTIITNHAPTQSNPVPTNGSTGITPPPSKFNITIADADDATQNMNITWKYNTTASPTTWTTFNTTTNKNNGTYSATNTSWVNQYAKKYWWKACVNDGNGGWSNKTYHFTTAPAVIVSNPVPVNGSNVACNVNGVTTSINLTFGDTEYSAGNGILFSGNKYLFNDSVYANGHQTVPIDGTRFLVAYVDSISSNKGDGIVKIGTESNGVISYGSGTTFHGSNATALAMMMMNSTHFVIVYNWVDGSFVNHLDCKVGRVSGSTITLGTNVSLGNEYFIQYQNPIDKLNNTHFVVVTQGPMSYAQTKIGNISGLTVHFGSWYQALGYQCYEYLQVIKALNHTKFVVMFADLYMQNSTCVIGVVSNGNQIAFGGSNIFLVEDVIAEYAMTVLNETRFVIGHPYNGSTILVATVSGTAITYGANQTIDSSAPLEAITFCTLGENKFVLSYLWGNDVSDYKAEARIGTVSGNNIVLHTAYLMNTGTTRDIYINNLSSSKIVASFIQRAGFPPDNAYHLIGTMTSGFELKWYYNSSSVNSVILRPNGNGFITGLQRNTGSTNYGCVDEAVANDATDYVYLRYGPGITDTYAIQDSSHSGVIDNISVYARMRMYENTETHPCDTNWGKITLRVNNHYYNSSTFTLTTGWVTYSYKWTTNPNTGSAWTWDDVDDLQAGISLGVGCYYESQCTQVYVKVNSSHLWMQYGENDSVINGMYSQLNENFSGCGVTYWWYVNVSDGIVSNDSDIYHFTTASVTESWHVVSSSINGSFRNVTCYHPIDSAINGFFL